MMTVQDENISSPALVELAVHVRSQFRGNPSAGSSPDKVIVKAIEIAKIYHRHCEQISRLELEVLYELLREFGIIAAHIPPHFHLHVANVIRCLEVKDASVTGSHVTSLIFSRM